MSPTQSRNSQQVCEQILRNDRAYNTEREILRSEVVIIDRLLAHGVGLADVYHELHHKLHAHHGALEAFLGMLLSTAAFWSPEKMADARVDREQITKVNGQIAKKAAEMASLLDQRADLNNTSNFGCETHYDILRVIEAASKTNHLFQSYVKSDLAKLHSRFTLKYWPSLSEIMQELATDADNAFPEAADSLTAAGTEASRASLADFFKALFAAMHEHCVRNHGLLPRGFSVTDNTLASLVNCALDLGPDDLVDAQYVKRLRQREREGTK